MWIEGNSIWDLFNMRYLEQIGIYYSLKFGRVVGVECVDEGA